MAQTRIGRILKERGATQTEAADLLGISITSFSRKARGWNSFKMNEINNLIEHYGITKDELWYLFRGERNGKS